MQEPGDVTVVMTPDGQSDRPGTVLVMILVIVPAVGQVDEPPVGPTGVDPVPTQSLQVVVSLGKRATGFALATKLSSISERVLAVEVGGRTSSPSLQARCDASWNA